MKKIKCYWKDATKIEKRLFFCIAKIFNNDQNLINLFFEKHKPEIKYQSSALIEKIKKLDPRKEILIRIALDIWSGSGNIFVWELFDFLNKEEFQNVIEVFKTIGPKFQDGSFYVRDC